MTRRILKLLSFIPYAFWLVLIVISFLKTGKIMIISGQRYILLVNLLAGFLLAKKRKYLKILGFLLGFGLGFYLIFNTQTHWHIGKLDWLGACVQFLFYSLLGLLFILTREKKESEEEFFSEFQKSEDYIRQDSYSLDGRKRIKTVRREDGKRINSIKRED